ncbi:MAG TPA: hypothetical protein VJH92_00920 [Candidatus Nanoarchaeia archaeon]|nr:hypothetical protein [Candidatus Nanoarchaeia archaeon]
MPDLVLINRNRVNKNPSKIEGIVRNPRGSVDYSTVTTTYPFYFTLQIDDEKSIPQSFRNFPGSILDGQRIRVYHHGEPTSAFAVGFQLLDNNGGVLYSRFLEDYGERYSFVEEELG